MKKNMFFAIVVLMSVGLAQAGLLGNAFRQPGNPAETELCYGYADCSRTAGGVEMTADPSAREAGLEDQLELQQRFLTGSRAEIGVPAN